MWHELRQWLTVMASVVLLVGSVRQLPTLTGTVMHPLHNRRCEKRLRRRFMASMTSATRLWNWTPTGRSEPVFCGIAAALAVNAVKRALSRSHHGVELAEPDTHRRRRADVTNTALRPTPPLPHQRSSGKCSTLCTRPPGANRSPPLMSSALIFNGYFSLRYAFMRWPDSPSSRLVLPEL